MFLSLLLFKQGPEYYILELSYKKVLFETNHNCFIVFTNNELELIINRILVKLNLKF